MFGLILSGGGLRGAVHVGFLTALDELGITPDFIVGTSAGSIAAALYASSPPGALHLDEISSKGLIDPFRHDWRLLFLPSKIFRRVLGKFFGLPMGLLSGRHLEWILAQLILKHEFNQLRVPIAVVTCDISNGKSVVFTRLNPLIIKNNVRYSSNCSVIKAVRASSSIPGIFAPINIDGHLLVDGGVVNNCPADIARHLGATKVVAVDLGFIDKEESPPDNAIEVLMQSSEIMGQRVSNFITDRYADLTLRPDTGPVSLIDFSEIPRLYELGKKLAYENRRTINKVLKKKATRKEKIPWVSSNTLR